MDKNIRKGVSNYYSEKIEMFGTASQGVDWNSKESQYVRFDQLTKVINAQEEFSVLDFGCGYGELVNYFNQSFEGAKPKRYYGFDIASKMVEKANESFGNIEGVSFRTELPEVDQKLDYAIASGIFNVKLDLAEDADWFTYILDTLKSIDACTTKGFAFNALTKYSDKEYMKDYLYYADPLVLFDYCKKHFSRNVALLHDYELYEFTIIVRK